MRTTRMLKKGKDRLLTRAAQKHACVATSCRAATVRETRAAQKHACVFATSYRAATVRERPPRRLFQHPARILFAAFSFWVALAGSSRADLQRAMAEPNLEKRSKLALENAAAAYKAMRAAYDKGATEQIAAFAKEVQESVELADTSLKQTGKVPRKSPKYFKAAEMATRDLLRKLESFQQSMSFDDRHLVEAVKHKVQQVHDGLLLGLMEGKRK
jgi:hypothetical protein